ncbi:MAG: 50S ribosomal protein L23 [Parcubacteria group bacterium GW2011_GWB1_45_9]|nr:MAG: 50S ribosomal protein L23 [Parcubacteria group bacterium GW2011_GWB1_45_9]
MTWFSKKDKNVTPTLVKGRVGVPTETSGKKAEQKTAKTVYNPSALKRVWITEKSTDLGNLRKYVFLTDKSANAAEIKKAVEGIYNVTVEMVHMLNFAQRKHFRGRAAKLRHYKKAIVTLAEGQELDVIPK